MHWNACTAARNSAARAAMAAALTWLALAGTEPARSATPGLPLTENFSDATLQDTANSTGEWSAQERAVRLPEARRLFRASASASSFSPAVTMYWGDNNGDNIRRSNSDGTGVTNIISSGLSGVTDLALDLANGHMYWVDGNTAKIQRANLDGSGVVDLVTGLTPLTGIALDVAGGKMYWIGPSKIQRANLDGSPIEDLVTSGVPDSRGPALDLVHGHMYWADSNTDKIQRANLDGTGVTDLVTSGLSGTSGIALDVANDHMYWVDGNTSKVQRANLDGSGVVDLVTGLGGALHGIALDLAGGKMYWLAAGTLKIQRANLNGSSVEDLVTSGLADPRGIALAPASTPAEQNPFAAAATITLDDFNTAEIAVGDVNGDGRLDLVAANQGFPSRYYLNDGVANPWDTSSGVGITADVFASYGVALGDVDGDGDLDLVTGNISDNLRLYLNNGTGSPWNGVSGSDITSDVAQTYHVLLGDVDADGDLDLIAGNYGTPSRLYSNNGSADPWGGVSGTNITSDALNTSGMALGDVDGDGDQDLVTVNQEQVSRLYLNDGDGNPWDGTTGSDITSDALNSSSCALGDVDGDGDLDLVVGRSADPSRVYFNNGTPDPWNGAVGVDIAGIPTSHYECDLGDVDGDGDLDFVSGSHFYPNNGTSTPWSGTTGIQFGNIAPEDVVLADVNSDGRLDLIQADDNGTNLLYLNSVTENPWNGALRLQISADAQNSRGVAIGDVNLDGFPDLVVANAVGEPNRYYENDGAGDPFDTIGGVNISADTDASTAIKLADMNRDGLLDVVVSNGGAGGAINKLYLNQGAADPWTGVTATNITAEADFSRDLDIGDIDLDGDLDIVVANAEFGAGEAKRAYLNDGTGVGWTGAAIGGEIDATQGIVLGDVNRDGYLDVAVANGHFSVGPQINRLYLNNKTSDPFAGVVPIDIGSEIELTYRTAMADVNGDGWLDFIALAEDAYTTKLYLHTQTATPYTTYQEISGDTQKASGYALADFDADGDLDFLKGVNGGQNLLFMNGGASSPFAGVFGVPLNSATESTVDLAAGDMDLDGDFDLVEANTAATPNRLYLSAAADGGGIHPWNLNLLESEAVSPTAAAAKGLLVEDFNRDGSFDLLVKDGAGPLARLYPGGASGPPWTTTPPDTISSDVNTTWDILAEDFDRDGDLDLVFGNEGSGEINRYYEGSGTGSTWIGSDIGAEADITKDIVLGDLDGDGDTDLVTGSFSDPTRMYLNDGLGNPWDTLSPSMLLTSGGTQVRAVEIGDVDRDGDVDIVLGNGLGGSGLINRLYRNNGDGSVWTESDITTDADDTHALALGDVDGDGDLDLVAGNLGLAGVGETMRLYLNDGNGDPWDTISGEDITTDLLETRSVELADIDSDGDLDLLVGGQNALRDRLYLNNGTANPWSGASGVDLSLTTGFTGEVTTADPDRDGRTDILIAKTGEPITRYQIRRGFNSARGRIQSLETDLRGINIVAATIAGYTETPSGTSVDFYLSNNGGARWHKVDGGLPVTFSTTGSDLRWRAELKTSVPRTTPRVVRADLFIGDETIPIVLAAYLNDEDNDGAADAGETLTLLMNVPVLLRAGLTPGDFYLPVSGDTLGGAGFGVELNPNNSRQIVLTLGAGAAVKVQGNFSSGTTTPGSPTGIDIAAGIDPLAIRSKLGIPARDGGTPGVNDAALDVKFTCRPGSLGIGSGGGTVGVANDPDAAYVKHEFTVPSGALMRAALPQQALTTFTLKAPEDNLGAPGAVQIESSNPSVTFGSPATITLEYRETDVDTSLGETERVMRVFQQVDDGMGSIGWVEVQGTHDVDTVNNTVSVEVNNLNPEGTVVAGPKIFAAYAGQTIQKNQITIEPSSRGKAKLTAVTPVALVGGPESAYLLTKIEIPGYSENPASTHEDRVTLFIDRPDGVVDFSGAGQIGQPLPADSNAAFVVRARKDSFGGPPVAFSAPVDMTIQFYDGTAANLEELNDVLTLSNIPAEPASMRVVADQDPSAGVDFDFEAGLSQSVNLSSGGGTVIATNVLNLTHADATGAGHDRIWSVAGLTVLGTLQDIEVTPGGPLFFTARDMDAGPSSATNVLITNLGVSTLSISSIALAGANPGDFEILSDTGQASLAQSQTRTVGVGFDPDAVGLKQAQLQIASNDPDSPLIAITLEGTGVDQEISVAPAAAPFGEQDIDAGASAAIEVAITNVGTGVLGISGVSIIGADAAAFGIVDDSAEAILNPSEVRTVDIVFDPASVGGKSAALQILSDDTNEATTNVTLSGTGVDQDMVVTGGPLDFGIADVDDPATAPQQLTIANFGGSTLNFAGGTPFELTGPNAGDFSFASAPDASPLAPSASRMIGLRFDPAAPGPKTATLVITSDGGTANISLLGEAVNQEARVEPSSIDFGTVHLNTGPSAPVDVTVYSDGSAPLLFTGAGAQIIGADAADFAFFAAPATDPIPPGGNRLFRVTFEPTQFSESAILRITTDDDDEPTIDVPLAGAGAFAGPLRIQGDWSLYP